MPTLKLNPEKAPMKTVLVFSPQGEFFKSIQYKTKKDALGNFRIFKKFGMIDPMTGEKINGLTFELI